MALRNAVKATLLLEQEQPRPRFDEPDPIFDAPAPAPPVAQRLAEDTKPRASGDALLAAACHKRAEELCAMAETLPSKSSWSLISKIAGLYDEIARDAGWRAAEEAAPAPDEPRREEPPAEDAPLLADEPPAIAPPPEPRAPERIAFRRRPLPSARPVPRRRA